MDAGAVEPPPLLAGPGTLWKLFRALPVGVVIGDSAGRILEANPAAEALLGLTRDEQSGRGISSPVWDIVRLDDSPMPPEEFASVVALKEGRVVRDVEMGVTRPDGGRTWLNVTAAPAEGGLVLITFQDIGPRVRDAAILRAQARLVAIPEGGGLEALLGATLGELELLTASRIGFFYLVDPDGENLHLQAWSPRTQEECGRGEDPGSPEPVSLAGAWADALRQARPVIHNDCSTVPGRRALPQGHAELARELVVPVIRQGRVTALVGVGNKPGPYTPEDLAAVQRLADLAWELADLWMAKEKAQQRADLIEKVSASVPGLVYTLRLGPDGTFNMPFITPMAEAIYGLSMEEIAKDFKVVHDRAFPEDRTPLEQSLEHSARVLSPWFLRWRYQHPVRGLRWLEGRALPRKEPDGSVLWHGFMADVTEDLAAKEDLRRSEDLMERIFAHSPHGMALVALDGRYLKVNLALCSILGRSEEELLALSIRDVTHPEDGGQDLEEIAALLAGRKTRAQMDKRYLRKDGQVVWAQVTVSLLRDEQGRPLHFVTHIRDLGERLRSDRERALTLRVLQILNGTEDPHNAATLLLHEIRESLGIEAAAIRLAQADDFTYAAHEGFPLAFVEAENCLRSHNLKGEPFFDGEGRPLFDCTCGLVLMGRADPLNPLFTPGGSAWTNDAQPLLDLPPDQDPRHAPRNRCIHAGYRSLALVPIRSAEGIVGMLQLNDSRPNCFDLRWVVFLEGIASTVGLAIERRQVHERLANSLQQLQDSEARFRQICETAEEWIWEVDAAGLYTYSSPVGEQLLGYAPGELVGRLHFYDLWPPGDREAFLPGVNDIFFRRQALRDLPNTLVRKDGSWLQVETTGVPVLDGQGRLLGYRGVDRNITQREAAQRELRLSEERFSKAFRLNPVPMAISRFQDMRTLDVNKAWLDITGIPAEEAIGITLEEKDLIMESGQREAMIEIIRRTGVLHDHPVRLRRKDGSRVDLLMSAQRTELGGESCVLSSAQDVTDLRKAQEALMESEVRFRGLFDHSPVAVWVEDLSLPQARFRDLREAQVLDLRPYLDAHPGELQALAAGVRILEVNEACLALMGSADAAELCRNLPSYFSADSYSGLRELMVALFEGRTEFESEINLRDGRGQRLDLQLRLSVLPGHEATLSRVLVTVADLTARKAAEAERRQLEQELNHLQRIESLGRLASGVSHDMNNVLGAIMAVGSVLQVRHQEDLEMVKDTETLLQAALRGRDLVKGLRDFSRKELESPTDLDLNQLAGREADLLERTTLKRVDVRLDLAPGLPSVFGEGSSVQNALMNLCSNAVDAMPRGGQLTLITRDLGQGFVELAVQDNGEGMSTEVAARALEPFFTTKPRGKGTGLGLSQVYGTMKAHGGTVDIQSQLGQGTRISLVFPAAPTKARPETEALPERGARRRNLAILLVDDEDLLRGAVKLLLEALGHRVRDASSGLEALRRLKGGQEADLVILDLNMPLLDGEETLTRLRILRPDLPVLLATGYADDRVPGILKRFPQVKILLKPFTILDVQELLAGWPS